MSSNTSGIGTSLNSNFFLRKFYSRNRDVLKSSKRSDFTAEELSYEDTIALKNAAKALSSFSYDSNTTNGANLYGTVKAFVQVYNNALSSGSEVDDKKIERQIKNLKDLTSKHADDLEKIGLSIGKNGKITISENLLKSASVEDVKKVFDKDNGYMRSAISSAKKINNNTFSILYAQATGLGGKINITL